MMFWATEWLGKASESPESIAEAFSSIVIDGLGQRR
jgi:hypothetical protein